MYNRMKEQEDFIDLLLISIESLHILTLLAVVGVPLVVVVTWCWPHFRTFQAGLIVVFCIIAVIVVHVLALPAIVVPIVFVPVVIIPVVVVVMMKSASFVGCTKPGWLLFLIDSVFILVAPLPFSCVSIPTIAVAVAVVCSWSLSFFLLISCLFYTLLHHRKWMHWRWWISFGRLGCAHQSWGQSKSEDVNMSLNTISSLIEDQRAPQSWGQSKSNAKTSVALTLSMCGAVEIKSAHRVGRGSDLQVFDTDFLGTRNKQSVIITVSLICKAKVNPKTQSWASHGAPLNS